MMRSRFARWVPDREKLVRNRFLRPIAHRLEDAGLRRLTRHSIARGVAIGLFAAFALPVGQVAFAATLAVPLRGNLAVAALSTLVTNPVTFPAVYFAAYTTGTWLFDGPLGVEHGPSGLPALVDSVAGVTLPTIVGLGAFAVGSSAIGYLLVRLGWRLWIGWRWRARLRARSVS